MEFPAFFEINLVALNEAFKDIDLLKKGGTTPPESLNLFSDSIQLLLPSWVL